ncbi:glycosyltransferase, partial [Haemophilus parahaemolyticus]|uniref:glycosyltransferase n=1 Tax=Haemophilus parahaemolyticus TaxID=735 RepID=UPI00290AE2EA
MEQCIESVIAQDYQNYELILVDDGSPDNSIDICIKYAKKYKNIIVIHKTNGGLSDARNAGIKVAQG